jgi:prolyl oligopeptidase
MTVPLDDPYLWLEDVTGDTALEWVRAANAETAAELSAGGRLEELTARLRQVLDADDRIPYVRRHGHHLYSFWQDARHPRGLWRRTTLESYAEEQPEWQVLLDVDALARTEGESWVWQGSQLLRPGYGRALVELSRGGADAAVVREFDLTAMAFVDNGFYLPEAKSIVGWVDADTVYVGTDLGPGSMTDSGYPRTVRRWRRGTPVEASTPVFEGEATDVYVHGSHDPTPGFERDVIVRALDFYRREHFLRVGEELHRIDVPQDVDLDVHREWLLVRNRSAWEVGGTTYPPGCLLAADVDAWMEGERDVEVLFEPDARSSLQDHSWTRHHLILTVLEDVATRMEVLTPRDDGWSREPLGGVPAFSSADIVSTDPDTSDEYFVSSSGFLDPPTLRYGVVGDAVVTIKESPAFFDTTGLRVSQHFATSDDGTRIPYFVVGQADPSSGPTLLTGYGGFEVPLTPSYSGIIGRGWLERGGTYVVANIRGGGEYGPRWHQSVQRRQRLKVYEDFAAVARDLVSRGVTTPGQLGIQGGSNGGLLTGVMLTRYPQLFGAVVCQVPLLDMRRYHLLLAGASWMAEYGDPEDEADWAYLSQYSPYHQVRRGAPYPPTLVMTSTRDDRVHPGHARKMVARLREAGQDVRYHENIEGGHGAAADNAQRAQMWAMVFEFLLRHLAP